MTRLLTGALAAITSFVIAIGAPTLADAQAIEPDLLESFGVLAASTVTNALGPDTSIIDGNLGLYAGTAITGFGFPTSCVSGGPGQVLPPSVCHLADAVAKNAQNDWSIAYGTLASAPATADLTGKDLGTVGTLKAGVYNFARSLSE